VLHVRNLSRVHETQRTDADRAVLFVPMPMVGRRPEYLAGDASDDELLATIGIQLRRRA